MRLKKTWMRIVVMTALTLAVGAEAVRTPAAVPEALRAQQASAPTRAIGTVKSMAGNAITLVTDAGVQISITTSDATKFLRVAPGQTTLQGATVIHLQDLQVGDRILARGEAGAGGTISAASIIVMKKTDLQARQTQEREEWARGVGGLVKNVDSTSGTITVNVAAAGTKTIEIHTTKETILRRYAPDSVQFDDAKPGTLDQIHPGDQLRARGTRSADGSTFDAQEIVSGAFRNIAGTIEAVDASANTIHVMDLISKKSFLVKFTPQSEIRQLAPEMAQRIAMRLRMEQEKGSSRGGPTAENRAAGGTQEHARQEFGERPGGFQRGAGSGADLQQMLNRLPPAMLGDLKKGEAVMIVSTEGAVSGEVTAITVLGGVEPILEAPSGVQTMTLSPWSLSAPAEGGDQP